MGISLVGGKIGVVDVLIGGGTGVSAGGLVGTDVVTVGGGTGLVPPGGDVAALAAAIDDSVEIGYGTGTGVFDVTESCDWPS